MKNTDISPTNYYLRLAMTLAVAYIGVFGFLVVLGNTTDYNSNYQFVQHVLSMDTTFPGNSLMYRSIGNPVLYHSAYMLIIFFEALVMFFCLVGAWQLFKNINKSFESFHNAKRYAVIGIIIGLALWFFGFQVVGGEWFAMWQSKIWNGLDSANRFLGFLFLTLLLLQTHNETK